MKKIDVGDIRKGDKIRYDYNNTRGSLAHEYIAASDGERCGMTGQHYLLERPEPPFEPKDGMHIQHEENDPYYSGVRINGWWLALDKEERSRHWFNDTWAKEKLASGWVVIEKPEGVK